MLRVPDVEYVGHTNSSLLIAILNELLSKDKGGEVKTRLSEVTPEYTASLLKSSQLLLPVLYFCHL